MKVYITGSTGFVGENIINLNPNTNFIRNRRNENIKIDGDFVFHFAGLAHNSNNDYSLYEESNYFFTKKIYDNFLKSNSRVFIFLSTIKVVGNYHDEITENRIPT